MDAKKLEWCCKQKKGIKLIQPNDNLANEYIQSSEEISNIRKRLKETIK